MQCTADDIRLHRVALCRKTEPLTSLPRTLPRFQAQYRGQFQKKESNALSGTADCITQKGKALCATLKIQDQDQAHGPFWLMSSQNKDCNRYIQFRIQFFGLKRVNGRGFRRQQQSGILQTCCSYAEVEHIMVGWGFETISNERHSVYFSQGKLDLQIMTMERNINYRRSKGVVSQGYMTATRRYPSYLQ